MLSVYTRHYPPCQQIDIHHRRCRCPKWIRGRLADEGLVRQSARTRSWRKAELLARELERRAESAGIIQLQDAIHAYIADQLARKLSPSSMAPIHALFEKKFLPWCIERKLFRLDQVRTPLLEGISLELGEWYPHHPPAPRTPALFFCLLREQRMAYRQSHGWLEKAGRAPHRSHRLL